MALILLAAAAARAAEPPAARTFVLSGQTYYAVPEDRLKPIGLPREDVPDDQNAAVAVLRVLAGLPRPPAEHGKLFNQATRGQWKPEYAPLEPWLDQCRPQLEALDRALSLPRCQFPILSRTPDPDVLGQPLFLFSAMMPHLAEMRQVGRICSMEGRRLEAQGEPGQAVRAYMLGVRLGAKIIGRDFLIADLVGIAVTRVCMARLEDAVCAGRLDAEILSQLAPQLDELASARADWSAAIRFERAAALRAVTPATLADMEGGQPGREAARAFLRSRAARILLPDRTVKAELAQYYDAFAAAAAMPPWEGLKATTDMDRVQKGEVPGVSQWNTAARMLLPALGRFAEQHVETQAHLQVLRLAVAARRYRLARGQWPPALQDLAPDYIQAVDPDPFTGRPMRCAPDDGAWKVWSVGRDLRDNGGKEKADVALTLQPEAARAQP